MLHTFEVHGLNTEHMITRRFEGPFMPMMHILIVDDSPLVGERLQKLLASIPATRAVQYLQSLGAASAHLRTVTPDILILDHNFPDGSGDELLVRHADSLRGTHVIIYSAYGSMLNHERYRELGASIIFDKADSPEDLLGMIESVVRLRQRRLSRTTTRTGTEGSRAGRPVLAALQEEGDDAR